VVSQPAPEIAEGYIKMLPVSGPQSAAEIKSGPPIVTVVICTHNRPHLLERCLEALQQVDYPNYSVVVIDSAPVSGDAKRLATRYRASYQLSPAKGLSRARNLGMQAAASSEIVAYLDDDMVPHVRWLHSLVDEFKDHEVMVVTGPMLAAELSESTDAEVQAALMMSPWGATRFQLHRSSPNWFERANFGGIGDGNFALRRTAICLFPGFDERLGRAAMLSGGEDHYAYFLLLKMGCTIAHAPSAIVFHPSSAMTEQCNRKRVAESVAYATFLMWRHPSQVLRVARYYGEGLVRVKRKWRTQPNYGTRSFSKYEMFAGALDGLSLFFRSLRPQETHSRHMVSPSLDRCMNRNATGLAKRNSRKLARVSEAGTSRSVFRWCCPVASILWQQLVRWSIGFFSRISAT
jgi:O-antigen biosynthesis protein